MGGWIGLVLHRSGQKALVLVVSFQGMITNNQNSDEGCGFNVPAQVVLGDKSDTPLRLVMTGVGRLEVCG